MKWTNVMPSESGYYWWRCTDKPDEAEVIPVTLDGSAVLYESSSVLWPLGDQVDYLTKQGSQVEFAGPIPLPEG